MTSFEQSSVDREVVISGSSGRRQTSLDREVYYDANNVRRDVVTYKPIATDKLGTVAEDFGLSNKDLIKYKDSMSDLARKLSSISSLNKGSRASLDTATKPLQVEVVNQARKSSSMGHLNKTSMEHIDIIKQDPFAPVRPERKKKSSSVTALAGSINLPENKLDNSAKFSNDVAVCRQSLSDIRDRIGSLQSLLQSSSQQSMQSKVKSFSDRPSFILPPLPPYEKTHPKENIEAKEEGKRKFLSHRNDSYSMAIEDDPVDDVVESTFQANVI